MNDNNKYFFDYFEERLKFIQERCLERIEGLVLMCCCIDAFAGYAYNHPRGEKFPYFKKFILGYSGEKKTWTKISLPLLKEYFKKCNMTKYAEFITKLGVNEKSYFVKDYNTDINIEEIERQAVGHIITPFSDNLKNDILNFEYVKILWSKYRNYAIHEMRSNPDNASNIFGQTESVYYNHQTLIREHDFKQIGEKINIGFPQSFIFKTVQQCFLNFKKQVDRENISIEY
ncbi:MAG: hypothetical protein DRP46_06990 [Candidatus Zixiibacteriota bacterium]|nr:MAG: hypothetical protein DRP46_06990 [candidate division Zixibacteria bacterium]